MCTAQSARSGGGKPDAKKELGRLLAVLDRLRGIYGAGGGAAVAHHLHR